ncbi:MAG: hypothetical protein RL723_1040 [Actinomycetota bacterium]
MPHSNFAEPEDVTGQAGWMFSDMLIALMVVFLATITFIPQFSIGSSSAVSKGNSSSGAGGVSGSYSYTEHFDGAFARAYQVDDLGNLQADIAAYLKSNSIPADAVVDSAQFIGGYSSTETSSSAIARALEFSKVLEAMKPGLLDHASTILNSSPKLETNLVAIRLTFSAQVNTK